MIKRGLLDTTLSNKVDEWHVESRVLSPGTPVSSTKKIKTDLHDITEILLKVALSTIPLTRIATTELVKMWYDFSYVNKR